MPLTVTKTTGDYAYGSPFVGPVDHTAVLDVPLSALTDDEIDSQGNLKPGIPLTKAGALVGVAPAFVYGVTVEAVKVAADNASATIAALGTIHVTVSTIAMVKKDMVEDILGRALTADELAGFDRAGSKHVLL